MLQRARTVTHLVHLKVQEQPPEGSQGRCLAEMRDRIAIQQAWQHQGAETAGSGIGWRFGFAAAFVALIGFNVATTNRLPASQPLVSDTPSDSYRTFGDLVADDVATRSMVLDHLFASNHVDTLHKVSEPAYFDFANFER